MEAVYNLCHVERAVPEVYGSVYDVRWLMKATVDLRDGQPLNDGIELHLPGFLSKPADKLVNKIINKTLAKLDNTDIGKMLRTYKVFDYSKVDK